MSNAKLLDVVALTVNLPQYDLWLGQVGTVVEMLASGTAFEVEFSDSPLGRLRHGFGILNGKVTIADDFDAP